MKTPLSALVCDDQRDVADTLSMLLMVSGHSVTTTYSGMQAMSAAERVKPDVAFLDIGLPDVNGYEVASAIRSKPWGSKVVLIAITGYGSDTDKRKAHEAGFNYHFTKPVNYPNLERLLESID
jgi:CheY-like chemotaxis protein